MKKSSAKKDLVVIAVSVAVCAAFLLVMFFSREGNIIRNEAGTAVFFAICLVVVIYGALPAAVKPLRDKPERLFLYYFIAAGLIACVLIPYGFAFDEDKHFIRVLGLAQFKVFSGTADVPVNISSIFMKEGLDNFKNLWSVHASSEVTALSSGAAVFYSPLSYLPQALGAFLSGLFTDRLYVMLVAARIFSLAAAAALLWAAVRIAPFGKYVIILISLSPLFVQQAASVSADGTALAAVVFLVAYYFRLKSEGENRESGAGAGGRPGAESGAEAGRSAGGKAKSGASARAGRDAAARAGRGAKIAPCPLNKKTKFYTGRQLAVMVLSVILIFSLKSAYALIGFVFLLLPKCNFPKRPGKAGIMAIAYILAAALPCAYLAAVYFGGFDFAKSIGEGAMPAAQLLALIESPLKFPAVFIKTMALSLWPCICSCFGLLLGSFEISAPAIAVILACFVITALTDGAGKVGAKSRVFLLVMTAVTFIMIFFVIYIQWTEAGADVVIGVQGRYFFPLVFPLVCALGVPARLAIGGSPFAFKNSPAPRIGRAALSLRAAAISAAAALGLYEILAASVTLMF